MLVLNLVLVVANTKFRIFSTAVLLKFGTDGRVADEARPRTTSRVLILVLASNTKFSTKIKK